MTALTLPRKVLYMDLIDSWYPDPTINIRQAADAGYNVINLAFYLTTGPADIVYAWAVVATEEQRQATLNYIHSKGAILIMSAGGATEAPYSTISGTDYGNQVGQYAKQYSFDGVDFDLENFAPGLTYGTMTSQQIIDWLSDCTTACKNALGSNSYISHAPQAPYLGPIGAQNTWAGPLGGYIGVNEKVGNIIDFYNIQFYNQGDECYTSYNGLFNNSCSNFPQTAVNQMAAAGIQLNKVVVGKPMLLSDASNGFVDPTTLGQWFVQAGTNLGWNAGVMTWQWHGYQTSKDWLDKVYPPSGVVIPKEIPEIYGYRCSASCKN